jgi:hypothetical protein
MTILSELTQSVGNYQSIAQPRIIPIVCDNTLTQVLASGFLNTNTSENFLPTDLFNIVYGGGRGFFTPTFSSSGIITLSPSSASGSQIVLAANNITGMYAAPVQLIAAPGPGQAIFIRSIIANYIYSAAFGGGGVIVVQYGNTAAGAGATAINAANLGAAGFLTGTANAYIEQVSQNAAASTSGIVTSGIINNGIYISNQTGAFTGGVGSTVSIFINYNILTIS